MLDDYTPPPVSATYSQIAAAMAGHDLDLENLGLHGGYGNISASIAQMFFDHIYNDGSHEFRCNNVRVGGFPLTPSDMPAGATSAGTQHLGDGTWRNQYSLAAGTHNGLIILADDQGEVALFSLVGTTVTLYANVAGSAWLDTADATHGQLRCSGGYLQVILGVSMANRYVTTFFIGNVR